ncbi:hypothetical protein [Weissella paramesenteroides]|uniref:hypothetical protein n=1 Tax=Weissella paramesenteroides TaxID=1249 RepID=UPI00223AA534|nr:hypothetical protein [Weissella paramesenteroides]MCT0484867.1 hypothetical protein [Weissella paramesenteroides]
MKYIGYHGTTKSNKEQILKNGFIINKNTWPNDLGYGIYNFIDTENFYVKAKDAANIYAKKYRSNDETACIINNISIDTGKLLNLNVETNRKNILKYRSMLTNSVQARADQYRQNHSSKSVVKRGNTDGFFLEKVLKTLHIEPDAILMDRWEDIDSSKYKTTGGQLPNSTVLVVRNIESIEKSS